MPFGDVRTDIDTVGKTDFGYTGQREIEGSELMDYNARFMNPGLARFTQPDTIIPSLANPQTLNRYSYVGNNPIRYVDPTGHKFEELCDDGQTQTDEGCDDTGDPIGPGDSGYCALYPSDTENCPDEPKPVEEKKKPIAFCFNGGLGKADVDREDTIFAACKAMVAAGLFSEYVPIGPNGTWELSDYLKGEKWDESVDIVIIGYSAGSNNAISLANEFDDADVTVDYLFLMEPAGNKSWDHIPGNVNHAYVFSNEKDDSTWEAEKGDIHCSIWVKVEGEKHSTIDQNATKYITPYLQ